MFFENTIMVAYCHHTWRITFHKISRMYFDLRVVLCWYNYVNVSPTITEFPLMTWGTSAVNIDATDVSASRSRFAEILITSVSPIWKGQV